MIVSEEVAKAPGTMYKAKTESTYQADGAPGKESRKARQSQEPIKDDAAMGGQHNVGESTPEEEEDNRGKRATRFVDIGEDSGGVTLVGEGREGTRTAVDARDANGDDRDANDDVHE